MIEAGKGAVVTASEHAADGRTDAFLRLTDRSLDASYRLACAILRDRSEAEDALHDALESAWGHCVKGQRDFLVGGQQISISADT